jgi:DNA-binding winged helix-turn-helix (wHTH) protein
LVHYNGRSAHFSPIDFALILILARQKNRIISYSRIYRRLWGPTSKVSVPRLRVHIFRARKRLDDGLMHGIRIINRGGGYLMELAGQTQDHSLRRKEFESSLDTSRTMRILHSPPMNDQEEVSIAAE